MEYIFHITQENRKLSIQEILSLYELKICKELDESHVLIITKDNGAIKLYKRLAYTNDVYEIFFSSTEKNVLNEIKNVNWTEIYKKSFAVRIVTLNDTAKKKNNINNKFHNQEFKHNKEREFAKIIYQQLNSKSKNPTVDLENPETLIVFFLLKNKYYCCIQLWQNEKSFLLRKPHLKPELHPTSLNPRLAKACVNLVITKSEFCETKFSSLLLDPFCGVGGILVEAGLLGIKTIGVDTEQKMLDGAEENINYYGIKDYKLLFNDATKITTKELGLDKNKITAIVTDLPYGKNTKKIEHEKLYNAFLKNATRLTEKMVVMFPDFVDYKKIILQTKSWKIKQEFSVYLHKSLSKKIVLLHSFLI